MAGRIQRAWCLYDASKKGIFFRQNVCGHFPDFRYQLAADEGRGPFAEEMYALGKGVIER